MFDRLKVVWAKIYVIAGPESWVRCGEWGVSVLPAADRLTSVRTCHELLNTYLPGGVGGSNGGAA